MNVTTQPIIDHTTLSEERKKKISYLYIPKSLETKSRHTCHSTTPDCNIKPYSKPDFDQMVRIHLQILHGGEGKTQYRLQFSVYFENWPKLI